ncbi:MAG: hypothetical protein AAB426_04780, partial [Myxococcota bacterium]
WRMAHDAGAASAAAAAKLDGAAVRLGATRRTALWHRLRGNVLRSLVKRLPEAIRLTIVN